MRNLPTIAFAALSVPFVLLCCARGQSFTYVDEYPQDLDSGASGEAGADRAGDRATDTSADRAGDGTAGGADGTAADNADDVAVDTSADAEDDATVDTGMDVGQDAVAEAGIDAGTCNSGWADCDGNPANGCEVNINSDVSHCGNCSTTCSTAPPATCVAGNLRTYTGPGTCATGTCSFSYADTPCNTPPGASCPQANVARTYSNPGSCGSGTCNYTYTDQTCNTPPSATCSGADARRYWDASGTCGGGSCSYTSHDQTCNTPPAATCADSKTLRTYVDGTSDCTGGNCTYAFADTTCGDQCTGGQCGNIACALPTSDAWTPNPCVNDKPSWTGSPTCESAIPIGRKAASTSPYFTRPNDDTCSTGKWDTSYTGCTSANDDRGYRIFMRTGETAHITVNRLGSCWDGSAWGLVFKTQSGTVCPVGSCLDAGKCTCTNHVNCFTPSSFPWNYDFVAPADRWYVFVIDGADMLFTGDRGHYSLTIQLTCNQADCECP